MRGSQRSPACQCPLWTWQLDFTVEILPIQGTLYLQKAERFLPQLWLVVEGQPAMTACGCAPPNGTAVEGVIARLAVLAQGEAEHLLRVLLHILLIHRVVHLAGLTARTRVSTASRSSGRHRHQAEKSGGGLQSRGHLVWTFLNGNGN